jgi:hypothetical protein
MNNREQLEKAIDMTNNITLPRAVAERLRNVLRWYTHRFWSGDAGLEATRLRQDVGALEDALAEQKPQVEGYNTNRDQPTFTITEDKT